MSGYLHFSRTGYSPFDEVIDMIENAGDAYHHTEQWVDDGWHGEKPYVDQIDALIVEAANRYDDLKSELADLRARLEKLEEVLKNPTASMVKAGFDSIQYEVSDPYSHIGETVWKAMAEQFFKDQSK